LDVLKLGRFAAWTLCLWTFCIWDILQLGRYVFGRFVGEPEIKLKMLRKNFVQLKVTIVF
jgi:hypothetical protein